MSLTLTIPALDTLENGLPARLQLNERGAIIGRSPMVSWCLPDSTNQISSRHCEIGYRDGRYILTDTSTNGTFVNGRQLAAAHTLRTGDVLSIGQYQIETQIDGDNGPAREAAPQTAGASGWSAWDNMGQSATPNTPADDWGKPKPTAAISGTGSMSQNWAPPEVKATADDAWGAPPVPAAPASAPVADPWGAPAAPAQPAPASAWASPPAPPAPATDSWGPAAAPATDPWATPASAPSQSWAAPSAGVPDTVTDTTSPWASPSAPPAKEASPWSSAAPDVPAAASTDDIWGKIAEGYVVDWARGGFGQPAPSLAASARPADPLGLNKTPAASFTAEPIAPAAFTPVADTAPAPPQAPVPPQAAGGIALEGLLQQLGLPASALKMSDDETLAMAGMLLRRLISGMVVMLEARARAKSQMGAQGTALQFDGNNPMKFARTPEQALQQLLNPPERGFMSSEKAIEDAFLDLQSHQMATLKAMQGALKATLDRFSPSSIRERADATGFMAKIFQDSRDAALWKAYEKEFGGVVEGSDEAFMDVFSREFRKAYDDLTSRKNF